MKKILLFFALIVVFGVSAQPINVTKQTFAYATKDGQTLNLDRYSSITLGHGQRKPCLIFVFGGGFVSGTRDNASYKSYFEYYAKQGYIVVSIDYRLGLKKAVESGTLDAQTLPMTFVGTLTMAVEDLYDATAYIISNADAWRIDPKLIVASGSSAGAITVLMGEYGICNGSPLAQKLPKDFNYAGVISYAGAIFGMGEELTWAKEPAPLMLFHGDADKNVAYDVVREQGAGFFGSKYIAEQLTTKRIPHWFYSVANTDHKIATTPMNNNRYEIDSFLAKFVKEKQPLVIDTYVTPLDAPEVPKTFTIMDYIQSNFAN